ncbi:MAG TPA: adenylate/guanylate cyclase domain-containing protein [Xanthobacteraceae bacterium]|nr:adenylate/guanylate cyclase domain-containing protein [Xanthobacteraceae bacterium]
MKVRAGGFYILLVSGVLAAVIAVRALDPFFVQALRLIAFDSYQRLSPQTFDPAAPVRIVDIDERSIAEIGQWPWPRTVLADLLQKLAAKGAAAIAFDVMFPEADRTSLEEVVRRMPPEQAAIVAPLVGSARTNDEVFAEALKATPSVLGATLSNAKTDSSLPQKAGFAVAGDDPRPFMIPFTGATGNLEILNAATKGIGALNWTPDRDQVVRRVALIYRLNNGYVPSLAAEALRVAQGASTFVLKASNASGETAFGKNLGLNHIRIGDLDVETDAQGAIWMKFRPTAPERFISAAKVLSGEADEQEISGRIILVGTSAPGLLDLRATPVDAVIPGVEIIAQMIEHVAGARSLTRPDYAIAVEEFAFIVLGILLAAIFPRVSARVSSLIGVAAIAVLVIAGWLAYQYAGLLFDPLYPALGIACLVSAATFYFYRRVELQRSEIQGAFGRYVSPAVVNELIADPDKLELGGEVREITLLFCDVRSFTSISERLSAHELTTFINELLTPLSEVILAHRGTIDKYIGDAIMAFWNAPLDEPAHAREACLAAVEMAGRMGELNRGWRESAAANGREFQEVKIGIGINTGNCCVGNLGSAQRFDYSAIGDEVNIASRFEGLSKAYGVTAIAGERTIQEGGPFPALELDLVRVKGRGRPGRIFTPLDLLDGDRNMHARLKLKHDRFLHAYRAQDWDVAEAAIGECRALGIAALETYYSIFAARIAAFRVEPPAANWDGAFTALEK